MDVVRRSFLHSHWNCTQPAIEQFPSGLFSQEQRLQGALVVHVLITLYVLCVLAVVCHEYFVPAIERVISVFKIESDVTGAAIMATVASTPQLATSVVGVFIAKSDIGVGAVVGSSYFNVFFIMGLCALCSREPLRLAWWPMFRDTFFYLLAATLLVILLSNQKALWSDGFVLLLAYMAYLLVLIFNARVEHTFTYCLRTVRLGFARCRCKNCRMVRDKASCDGCDLVKSMEINENIPKPVTTEETLHFRDTQKNHADYSAITDTDRVEAEDGRPSAGNIQYTETPDLAPRDTSIQAASEKPPEVVGDDQYHSILHPPETVWRRVVWALLLPALAVIYLVIPDCRRPSAWRYLFVVTILMSVVVIGLSAYVLVWMVAIIGSTIGIPDTIMGLTFLAAGASLPDLMNAVIVSRLGYGDMAVSNCIGSNIFDILVCLGLPWMLEVIFERRGDPIIIYDDISSISICLIVSGLIVFACLFITNWSMNKVLGWVFTAAYLGFIIFTVVFDSKSALPTCKTSL